MGSDQVRDEPGAVRSLRHGLERFSDQIRLAASDARREMQHRERQIHQELERRRAELHRREHEVEVIQVELARCREGCAALMAALRGSVVKRAEAAEACIRAQKAADAAAEAKSELTRALLKIETTVDAHSKRASPALASIEKQLAELVRIQPTGPAAIAVTIATLAQVATSAPNFTHLAGNFSAALGHSNPVANSSITEAVEESHEQLVGQWADQSLDRLKRKNGTEEELR